MRMTGYTAEFAGILRHLYIHNGLEVYGNM